MGTKKQSKAKNVSLDELQENLSNAVKVLDTISKVIPSVINTEIKPFGNSSHIILPKEYAGKKAKVIINK